MQAIGQQDVPQLGDSSLAYLCIGKLLTPCISLGLVTLL